MVYLLLYVDDIILTAYSTELLRRTIFVLQLEFAISLRGGGGGGIRCIVVCSIIVFLQRVLCIFSPSYTCIYSSLRSQDEHKCYS
jgi:hypothetical protein